MCLSVFSPPLAKSPLWESRKRDIESLSLSSRDPRSIERERERSIISSLTPRHLLRFLIRQALSRDDDDDDDDDDKLLKCSTKHSRRKTTKSERDDDTNI